VMGKNVFGVVPNTVKMMVNDGQECVWGGTKHGEDDGE